MITDLIQAFIVTSYIVTLLVLSVRCCWATANLPQHKGSNVFTCDKRSLLISYSTILNDGKAIAPTKQFRSMERNRPSKQLRSSVSYLVIILLLAGDVHQNPGPNSSCNGDPRRATATIKQGTVDPADFELPQRGNPSSSKPVTLTNVTGVLPATCSKIPNYKQRNFLLLQTTNHAKVLWDPRAKPKGLLGGHLNIRSVASKTEQLEKLLMDSNLDFLCLSESWLTDSSPDTAYIVPGYNVFRKDRKLGRGGGLLMYVKNHINCKEIDLDCVDIECMAIRMILSANMSFTVICIYRPPSSNCKFYEYLKYFERF